MPDQKIRRKTFITTIGAAALGWVGLRADTRPENHALKASTSGAEGRATKEPRAVPCAGRTL
ncbi:hypothetical protein G0Q06_00290 [Puniceicoccales bacterium CK1056]|uniref:Uncharacterized protein n=1 Tax=Oceanipulchritudo coccoides TaxID=2706888 RepID=A0A6B2LY93_9BACT|nr:hypothetical protein [Oceanipulchritudo coccoides]NDV60884.1 hypothetical protein [Oceanipulchritudo coccoides]